MPLCCPSAEISPCTSHGVTTWDCDLDSSDVALREMLHEWVLFRLTTNCRSSHGAIDDNATSSVKLTTFSGTIKPPTGCSDSASFMMFGWEGEPESMMRVPLRRCITIAVKAILYFKKTGELLILTAIYNVCFNSAEAVLFVQSHGVLSGICV